MPERRAAWLGAIVVAIVYAHNTLPYLTTLPRVNVDEPWLMERAYQVVQTGAPRQPMFGLDRAYLLQPGYSYVLAPWIRAFGLGIFQARLLTVLLGAGILAATAAIASRLIGTAAGPVAALFLAGDSNFLGGARDARTDIPAVCFASLAIWWFLVSRDGRRPWAALASGVATGAAMLCHGNCYWVAVLLLAWYLVDRWRRPFAAEGWLYAAGIAATLAPYAFAVARRWPEFQRQLQNFAADRVPGHSPVFVWQQVLREPARYRGWYFGLVTARVPEPLLWVFAATALVGTMTVVVRGFTSADEAIRRRSQLAALLALVPAAVFAGFINNKALVYMPHLLVGFAVAASAAVVVAAGMIGGSRAPWLATMFVCAYAAVAIGYYEKWYRTALRSEVEPYEHTAATVTTLVPAGPKLVIASPHFWLPFARDPQVTFLSYTAAEPDASLHLARASGARPTYLLVDETQWLADLGPGATESTEPWRRAWIAYIERRCGLDGTALGTGYGTLALFRCEPAGTPRTDRLVGGGRTLSLDGTIWDEQGTMDDWRDYPDPRRRPSDPAPHVERRADGIHVSGSGWPGVERYAEVTPGDAYAISYVADGAGPRDLLYVGRWERPEVTSLAGTSAAGIVAPLAVPAWFPSERGFVATADRVRLLVYSEAPSADFVLRRIALTRLR